jgi:hypothetical protein
MPVPVHKWAELRLALAAVPGLQRLSASINERVDLEAIERARLRGEEQTRLSHQPSGSLGSGIPWEGSQNPRPLAENATRSAASETSAVPTGLGSSVGDLPRTYVRCYWKPPLRGCGINGAACNFARRGTGATLAHRQTGAVYSAVIRFSSAPGEIHKKLAPAWLAGARFVSDGRLQGLYCTVI